MEPRLVVPFVQPARTTHVDAAVSDDRWAERDPDLPAVGMSGEYQLVAVSANDRSSAGSGEWVTPIRTAAAGSAGPAISE